METSTQRTVIVLSGNSGPSKSRRIERLRTKIPCELQIYAPAQCGETLDASTARWEAVDAVAIDELMKYDEESRRRAVPALEAAALDAGKTLILITQEPEDLKRAGITLQTEPLILDLSGGLGQPEIDGDPGSSALVTCGMGEAVAASSRTSE